MDLSLEYPILTPACLAEATAFIAGQPAPVPDLGRCCLATLATPATAGALVLAAPGIVVGASPQLSHWVGYSWAIVKDWYGRKEAPGQARWGVVPGPLFAHEPGTPVAAIAPDKF